MAQIINREPTAGQLAGQGFASSLSGLLQNLAAQKAQQIQSKQIENQLINAGINPQQAKLFSLFSNSPDLQKAFVSQLDFPVAGQNNAQVVSNTEQQPRQAFDELVQQQVNPGQPSTEQLMQMLQPQNVAQDSSIANLSKILGINPQDIPFASPQMQMYRFMPQMAQQQMQQMQNAQQQAPVQQTQEQPQPAQPVQTKRLFESPELQFKREEAESKRQLAKEKFEEQKQQKIVQANKPFVDAARTQIGSAKKLLQRAISVYDLVKTGEVASGPIGAIVKTSKLLQNQATREADKGFTEIATDLAASQRGPLTQAKLRAAERQKPAIDDTTEVQLKLLENNIEYAAQLALQGDIIDSIIQKNGGKQPPNLESLVRTEAKKFENLPVPIVAGIPDGKRAIDDATGQVFAVVRNGLWEPA